MPSEGEFYIGFDRIAKDLVIDSPERRTTWEAIDKEIIRVWGGEGIDYIYDWRSSRLAHKFLVERDGWVTLGKQPVRTSTIKPSSEYL